MITSTTVEVVVPRSVIPAIYGEGGGCLRQICEVWCYVPYSHYTLFPAFCLLFLIDKILWSSFCTYLYPIWSGYSFSLFLTFTFKMPSCLSLHVLLLVFQYQKRWEAYWKEVFYHFLLKNSISIASFVQNIVWLYIRLIFC